MIYEFTPTQDLHGYAKPWAPGAGANQWDEEWEVGGYLLETGLPYSALDRIRSKNKIPVLSETEYYIFHPYSPPNAIDVFFYAEDNTFLGYKTDRPASSFTTPENCAFINFCTSAIYGTTYKNDIAINYPSSITSYSPYSNICPISGYNIWDPSQDKMVPVYSGYVDANARKLYLHPVYEEYDGEELVGPWMSSMDEYTEDGTPTEGAFVVDFGGDVNEYDITDFMLQTLLDSLGVRRFFASGAMLLNSLMDQAQGRVRSEEELLNRSLPLHVIAIGKELPGNLVIKKPVSDVLPGLPGKIKI